ncbi:MAG: hypothetical protein J3Q66DRAFT_360642 [Benniella sp.]|nr:MAG: hypothetical protein J3Q66DRAFT_360642 [Benniella sp.]
MSQPLREHLCQIIKMSMFECDFLMGMSSYSSFFRSVLSRIDRWHSTMLPSLRPSKQFRPLIFSAKQRAKRRGIAWTYGPLYVVLIVAFVMLVVRPLVFSKFMTKNITKVIPS